MKTVPFYKQKLTILSVLIMILSNWAIMSSQAQVLYGPTQNGGINTSGTIIKFDATTNTLTTAINLKNDVPGAKPVSSIVEYNGKFYGVTTSGGSYDDGVIYEWDPSTNIYTKKFDFNDKVTGRTPNGELTLVNDKFYGVTTFGGANGNGGGTIFEWNPTTNDYTVKREFSIFDVSGNTPVSKMVLLNGKLYGTTIFGGNTNNGVIFEFDPATDTYTKKYNFDFNSRVGVRPRDNELLIYNSKLYGMTNEGGTNNVGVIFEFDPATDTYTKKYDFKDLNGEKPYGGLSLLNDKFYGTTSEGGTNNVGVIFEFDPATDTYTKKYDFDNTNGTKPFDGLTLSGSKFYGTTSEGGANGVGVIFEFDPATNTYTKKYDFDDTNGARPLAELVLFNGKFYSTTNEGGLGKVGVIFEWDPNTNVLSKKIDFSYKEEGGYPIGSFVSLNNKFYGVTYDGGDNNLGVIFELDPVTDTYTKKYDFDRTNGGYPTGTLTLLNNKLYGTTEEGGINDENGVIFEFDLATNTYTKKHDFEDATGSGSRGGFITLNNKLYGMAIGGGNNFDGAIFEFDPATDTYTKKYDFEDATGRNPWGELVLLNNKFYGMTSRGGANSAGVIFEFDPATDTYTKKHDFLEINGERPLSSLIVANEKLYGTTFSGGSNDDGVIFEFDPATNTYTKKHDFLEINGETPRGKLTFVNNKLYGMTTTGGMNDAGVIFEFDLVTDTYTKKQDLNVSSGFFPRGSLILFETPEEEIETTVTSLSDIENEVIIAYPNPTESKLMVDDLPLGKTIFILSDAMGNVILVAEAEESLALDLAPLPSGIYTLTLNTNKGIFTRKIVKK